MLALSICKSTAMPTTLRDLHDEAIVTILEFLRAVDIVSTTEVSKSLFQGSLITKAVNFQLDNIYPAFSTPLKERLIRDGFQYSRSVSTYGCDMLFICEVKAILFALGSPSVKGKGYWISASWVANAKKYYETLTLPEIKVSGQKSGVKKISKIRQRRKSDALPPWPSMNADITCRHGAMALATNLKTKRRLIDSRTWHFLRKFYPSGLECKSTNSGCVSECEICADELDTAIASKYDLKLAKLKERQSALLMQGPLGSVYARKNGVPSHLLTQRMIPVHEDDWEAYAMSSCSSDSAELLESNYLPQLLDSSQPLLPGLYNLVSKSWLKSWRNYHKEPGQFYHPSMDCTKMLCHSHGLLVIPPHVGDYLLGVRKSLLGGLGLYPGEVAEILCADEWDSLQVSLRSLSDFSVRFCLDGDTISWNIGVCVACDPFSYGPNR